MKTNNRLCRTKDAIISAYFELLETEENQKVTISSIIEKANISRGTYYKYFYTKESIFEEAVNYLFTELEAEVQTALDLYNSGQTEELNLVPATEIIAKHKRVYRVGFREEYYQTFYSSLMNFMEELIAAEFSKIFKDKQLKMSKDFLVSFVSTGINGIISVWAQHNFEETSSYIAHQIQTVLFSQDVVNEDIVS